MTQELFRIKGDRFVLKRDRDDEGDAGPLLAAIDPATGEQVGANGEIAVGCAVQCGTYFARSYDRDYWLTTPIQEILARSEDGTSVTFRTSSGSTYTVRGIGRV